MLVIAAALCCSAYAQEKFEVKVAEFVGAQHFMSKWLVGWGEKLEKASGGRLQFKHFAGATMAPVPGHYDLAASGRAEVSWFLHGATPGRFPRRWRCCVSQARACPGAARPPCRY